MALPSKHPQALTGSHSFREPEPPARLVWNSSSPSLVPQLYHLHSRQSDLTYNVSHVRSGSWSKDFGSFRRCENRIPSLSAACVSRGSVRPGRRSPPLRWRLPQGPLPLPRLPTALHAPLSLGRLCLPRWELFPRFRRAFLTPPSRRGSGVTACVRPSPLPVPRRHVAPSCPGHPPLTPLLRGLRFLPGAPAPRKTPCLAPRQGSSNSGCVKPRTRSA